MTTPQAHYEDLLARHYTWMLGGDIEAAAAAERELLEQLGIGGPTRADAVALDLGCGPGPQSLALADLGYPKVIGVDTSRELLDELAEYARGRPVVSTMHADLLDALLPGAAGSGPIEAIVCMRDTVVHLADHAHVIALITGAREALTPGGRLVLTYRDLTGPISGLDRFLPIRSDAERIMLCALDPESERTVTVNDLVYTRGPDGWDLQKSSYTKLRIGPDWLRDRLADAGLSIERHEQLANGMWATVARAPGR